MPAELRPGQVVTYYPRAGLPGREVTVVEIRKHPFHGAIVRFRDARGREREMTVGRFHRER